jgi:ClpP class serine protease
VGREKSVAVLDIRGPLDHHADSWGESYEAIIERLNDAIAGRSDTKDGPRSPASAIVLRIDSPGGVVSGLNETTERMQSIRKACGIPLYAYVDEMAASAAYELACACTDIFSPPSAILGSIGVISTMGSRADANEAAGVRIVTLTSGARKSDGHPDVPITDAAMKAEQGRVDELARQFFAIVSKARGIPVAKIEGFQAGIFLGAAAVKAGLSDGVLSWERFVKKISLAHSAQTRTHSAYGTSRPSGERTMPLNIDALIAKKTAALAAEQDPDKRLSLAAELHSAKKTKKEMDDEEERCETEEDETKAEAEKKKKEAAKKKAEADAAARAAALPASTSTLARTVAALTGETDEARMVGALQGLVDKAAGADALEARLDALEAATARNAKNASIDKALADGDISKAIAAKLRAKSAEMVAEHLDMVRGSKAFATDKRLEPRGSVGADGLDDDTRASIDAWVKAAPAADQAALRADLIKAHLNVTTRDGAGSH